MLDLAHLEASQKCGSWGVAFGHRVGTSLSLSTGDRPGQWSSEPRLKKAIPQEAVSCLPSLPFPVGGKNLDSL